MLEVAFYGYFDSYNDAVSSSSSSPDVKSLPLLTSFHASPYIERGVLKRSDGRMGSGNDGAVSGCCDSVANVLALNTEPETFGDTWFHMFVWSLFSSFLVHTLSALVALCKLYRHPIGRFYPVLIFFMGIISPLTAGACTSAVIAVVFKAANWTMPNVTAMIIGIAQTGMIIVVSATRIMATL